MVDLPVDSSPRQENPTEKKPYEELLPCAEKILRKIPVVRGYGMREDGYYTIHIVDGYVKKASRYIKKHIPGYKFNFVPWMKGERIHLLGCTGASLKSRVINRAEFDSIGTLGGLVATNTVNGVEHVYAATANHVVDINIHEEDQNQNTKTEQNKIEFMTWSKDDESDIRTIGTEVSYNIPLKLKDRDNEDEDEWVIFKDSSGDDNDGDFRDSSDDYDDYSDDDIDVDSRDSSDDYSDDDIDGDSRDSSDDYSDDDIDGDSRDSSDDYSDDDNDAVSKDSLEDGFTDDVDTTGDENGANDCVPAQYDIALVLIDEKHKDLVDQCKPCHECCSTLSSTNKDVLTKGIVVKLGFSKSLNKGKIKCLKYAGEIEIDNKTAWCSNLVIIGSVLSSEYFSEEGDSGTIVEIQYDSTIGHHSPDCFMVFAGWEKEYSLNVWKCPVSLAFNLKHALEKLSEQLNNDDETEKMFRLSCCKHVTSASISIQANNEPGEVINKSNSSSQSSINEIETNLDCASGTSGTETVTKLDSCVSR
ncbi:unnamed protein product [Owenia fusiformis]|uniref:Uncharacterized protein n=1 Tax=Owenia fusiformis TaxID=6347 RepID=A0A8S4Q9Y0_OWEFU|nr:unnamed protein product [Owenia fusiformis]